MLNVIAVLFGCLALILMGFELIFCRKKPINIRINISTLRLMCVSGAMTAVCLKAIIGIITMNLSMNLILPSVLLPLWMISEVLLLNRLINKKVNSNKQLKRVD